MSVRIAQNLACTAKMLAATAQMLTGSPFHAAPLSRQITVGFAARSLPFLGQIGRQTTEGGIPSWD
jgi:hypothetical protein